ncbi:helix-turn-helix domain-containing protein [Paraburkholderia caballeronis]|uniref:helix-turn-helix domain-containing protein n=1 Tax=Paraburkholderia caballeronis TaxID=416943 RepID=UPI001066BE73|nr:helix-turn-helix domain-containing protein [Paraburkholderia caballeronis]TDV07129.1 CRP/FNR family transcriptional regulator [Paraburkholderia caballeronis]TDV11273.1 CRP/FNR family transcriptional regulator [Paraburkholderia caballeronis]TDV22458.1 CRP/FNR family transcriptional regulator [Paraburkholderia caballeronis]
MPDVARYPSATAHRSAFAGLPVHALSSEPPLPLPRSRAEAVRPVILLSRADAAERMEHAGGTSSARNAAPQIGCERCSSRDLCMPPSLRDTQPAGLVGVFGNSRKIERGEAIYRAGDAFENLYVLRAGSSKTIALHRDGREQITGFQISGEFIGMEGLTTGVHTLDAIALEDSVVCAIPFRALESMSYTDRDLQRHMNWLMSREIVRESAHLMLMGSMNAEERVAAFLLNLSQRYRERGYSATEFQLRMTRDEIGCYLGLKLETVSRMLTRLQKRGLIQISGKKARIVDLDNLERV